MPKAEQKRLCPTCESELVYSKRLRKWICEQCLYGAYLTDQAQRESVKRYRTTDKGKEAEKRYEQSPKGKTARERYLKSDKYKERRREYNKRLKESLAIARAAQLERPKALTEAETERDERAALIQDIREHVDTSGKPPSVADVRVWGKEEYKLKLTDEQVRELIRRAQQH